MNPPLDLYDLTGRCLWSWTSRGELAAGPHTFAWNGRDRARALAPSGVYIVRARAGSEKREAKLVLRR